MSEYNTPSTESANVSQREKMRKRHQHKKTKLKMSMSILENFNKELFMRYRTSNQILSFRIMIWITRDEVSTKIEVISHQIQSLSTIV